MFLVLYIYIKLTANCTVYVTDGGQHIMFNTIDNRQLQRHGLPFPIFMDNDNGNEALSMYEIFFLMKKSFFFSLFLLVVAVFHFADFESKLFALFLFCVLVCKMTDYCMKVFLGFFT